MPRMPPNGCYQRPLAKPSMAVAIGYGRPPPAATSASTRRNAMISSRTSSKSRQRSSKASYGTSTGKSSLPSTWQRLWDTSPTASSQTLPAFAPKNSSLPHWRSSRVILSSILSTQSSLPPSKPLTPEVLTSTIRFICPLCSVEHSLGTPLSSSTNTKTSTQLTMQCLHALSKGALLELAIHGRTSTGFVELRLTAWPKPKPSTA